MAIYLRFIWVWAKFLTLVVTICMLSGKFHCCKWPNIENTIWSSGHTVRLEVDCVPLSNLVYLDLTIDPSYSSAS